MVKIISQPTSILTQPFILPHDDSPGSPGNLPPLPSSITSEFLDLPFILTGVAGAASPTGFVISHPALTETVFLEASARYLDTIPPSPGPKPGYTLRQSLSPQIEFHGEGLRYDSQGNPIGGVITSYSATDPATGQLMFEISGLRLHISSMIAAAQTQTMADDLRLFNFGGNDLFIGGDYSDMIKAGRGDDRLFGFGEKDTLDGGAGDDRLYGGADSDRLHGGDGRDFLDGGEAADLMAGGNGDDSYIVDASDDVVTELAGGGRDTVRATASFTLTGEIEHLILIGNRLLTGTGNAQDDVITGNAGRSHLFGLAGDDRLDGGDGADVLNGGLGRDFLTGGAGADRFDFDTLADSTPSVGGRDIILDFTIGEDRIDLTGIDADTSTAGNQAFVLADRFHDSAGELLIIQRNDSTVVQGDVDGDGRADFALVLRGEHALTTADFLL